jgi:hypothetical protein
MLKLFPLVGLAIALQAACGPAHPAPAPSGPLLVKRPAGRRDYVFTSTQQTPAGATRVEVAFTLETLAGGAEQAIITAYRHGPANGPLAAGQIDRACAQRLTPPTGAIAILPITPPPHRLADLIADCVPEDLFGATSDILPLLMIQAQPVYRAAELRAQGDRRRFNGYATTWRLPPSLRDARIVADSGVITLDSLTSSRAVIDWDTSPMRVDLVRDLAPNQRMLLSGEEWFRARIVIDPRTGALLGGHTVVDSLALDMITPYADSVVPPSSDTGRARRGMPVVVVRSLDLRPAKF